MVGRDERLRFLTGWDRLNRVTDTIDSGSSFPEFHRGVFHFFHDKQQSESEHSGPSTFPTLSASSPSGCWRAAAASRPQQSKAAIGSLCSDYSFHIVRCFSHVLVILYILIVPLAIPSPDQDWYTTSPISDRF